MGYRRMQHEDIYQIFRRWHAGHKIKRIAISEGCDRKTVREYVMKLQKMGFRRDTALPEKKNLLEAIGQILPDNKRPRQVYDELIQYEKELYKLIHDKKEPLKPKTAFSVIKIKYGIKASYETFKRFSRDRRLSRKQKAEIIRIELPPGLETQIDYGKVGYLEDEIGRNRCVWAFSGVLSNFRYPFVQFVFKQDQVSFVESIVSMFEFYGGATEILSMDNLKAGVIKPDLWDPKLNKTCADMADYYGVFIDPCRVGKATDKGKVERFIPTARELFRMLKNLYPTANIHTLNRYALGWCREEYGMKEHGTTGIPPFIAFEQVEKGEIKSLPDKRFVVPVWKKVTVHDDRFFEFERKYYALPAKYRGRKLWVRKAGKMLTIFDNHTVIREYVVTQKKRNYLPEDFPEGLREMMEGEYPRYLLKQADRYCKEAYLLIESVLEPHAYLNARRARGLLSVMENYSHKPYFREICSTALHRGVKIPKTFKAMLDAEEEQGKLFTNVEISKTGKEMLRDIKYYIS